MKKGIKILGLVCALSLFAGCGTKAAQEETIKCTMTSNMVANGYRLDSEYVVHAKGDIVSSVETIETVTSSNSTILDYFKETLDTTYSSYNSNYGGYTNTITVDGDKLVSKTTVDYSKMDMKKFIEDNSAMTSYVNSNNEMLKNGVISMYEALGAVCEK